MANQVIISLLESGRTSDKVQQVTNTCCYRWTWESVARISREERQTSNDSCRVPPPRIDRFTRINERTRIIQIFTHFVNFHCETKRM